MDANNIAWRVEGKRTGYPAGGFFTRVLDMIFEPPKLLDQRLRLLVEIFNMADLPNTAQLDAILPGVRPHLVQLYEGQLSETDALLLLRPMLRVLPQLLARMDVVATSIQEYAFHAQQAQREGRS